MDQQPEGNDQVTPPELVESPLRGNAHGGFGGAGRRNGPSRKHDTALRPDPTTTTRRCRTALRRRGIGPRIARRGIESSVRLGRHRWRIERTGAWLGGFRRLRIRYERSSERFYALAMLACSVICFQALGPPRW
jgi:IS5 family transposase